MGWGAMPEGPLFPTIAGQTPFWKAPQSTLRLEDGSSVTLQVGGKVRPGQRPALPAPPPWRTGSPPHSSREPGSPENGQVGLQGSTGGGLFFTPSLRCWVCLRRGTAWGRTEPASHFASCLRTALWLDPPPRACTPTTTLTGSSFSLLCWLVMCVQHSSEKPGVCTPTELQGAFLGQLMETYTLPRQVTGMLGLRLSDT